MALSETWFMDGYIDFELQRYKLLAYLQEVGKHFTATKLYPQLSDIIFHYSNLLNFQKNKQVLQSSFPKELNHINMEKLKLVYNEMLQDNEMMAELERIITYAINKMKYTLSTGAEIYERIEQQLCIEPVGIMPLYKNEGYLMLRYAQQNNVSVYYYSISLFEHQDAKYKGIKMEYIDNWTKNISITYEHIKTDIIRTIRTLPNPAVYFIESPLQIPLNETLLPIAKRTLVRYIEKGAA
jgi:hypothetical protein